MKTARMPEKLVTRCLPLILAARCSSFSIRLGCSESIRKPARRKAAAASGISFPSDIPRATMHRCAPREKERERGAALYGDGPTFAKVIHFFVRSWRFERNGRTLATKRVSDHQYSHAEGIDNASVISVKLVPLKQ